MSKKKNIPVELPANNKGVLNLPSVELPIKPLTVEEVNRDMRRRISNIKKEFTVGFDFIKTHPKSVTFFGSARLKPADPYYQKAVSLAKRLAKEGYAVVTGGGPGVMEAANLGALKGKGDSLGLTIRLPKEQVTNPYVSDFREFHYFFTRKVCLTFSAEAYIYFPGGYGTLDEFFEILTLVQTNKIERVPIVLVGRKFWRPMHSFLNNYVYQRFKAIDKEDMKLYYMLDDEEQIVEIIKRSPVRQIDR
ncbi:MAG: TIGR00730 family Rossman fold protein [Candidatus Buchananbacteria bacterium]|nr:TIGR00730 family Rossman fold protein [Candidatus Buchananbacteria bacterium]